MIDKITRFHKAQEMLTTTMTTKELAEVINVAIHIDEIGDEIPWYEKRSFLRRAFRNTVRLCYAYHLATKHPENLANELAKLAGFHQYKEGQIVDIFECIEQQ